MQKWHIPRQRQGRLVYEVHPLGLPDRAAVMGWRIAEEVQEHAPASLTWRELYVACVLANVASEDTRICRPGLQPDGELAARLRITDKRELLRVIERLIEAKVIERVTRGQKRQQAEFRFLPLGSTTPVQGGETTHPDESQDGGSTHPEDGSGWGFSPLRVGDSPRQGGGNPHPSQGLNEDQSLLPSQRILRSVGLTLGDEDEKSFIDWINRNDHKGAPWWRKVAAAGDLPSLVAKWRAETATAATGAPNGLPPWCGKCGVNSGGAAQYNPRLRTVDGRPCSTCSPEAVRRPGANSYQPYRNPEDQSVYLDPIG